MGEVFDIKKGDKVVVLRGNYKGLHGTIDSTHENSAIVILLKSEGIITLPIELLQNYSSAARKAWRTRPKRATGRPKDPDIRPKRMISLRLDIDLWEELRQATEAGLIRSREAAVNQWLREKLDELWENSKINRK
jgi:uncharacterized protein (DUF4415 family)